MYSFSLAEMDFPSLASPGRKEKRDTPKPTPDSAGGADLASKKGGVNPNPNKKNPTREVYNPDPKKRDDNAQKGGCNQNSTKGGSDQDYQRGGNNQKGGGDQNYQRGGNGQKGGGDQNPRRGGGGNTNRGGRNNNRRPPTNS